MLIKLVGPIHNRKQIPLRCKFCGKQMRPSGRKEQHAICNRCSRQNRG